MSCQDCQSNPIESHVRWKNARVKLTGCAHHVTEIMSAMRVASQITALSFDPTEIDKLLEKDWNEALPTEYQEPFLRIVSQLGALTGLYKKLVEVNASNQ